jgi:hypothetical protein
MPSVVCQLNLLPPRTIFTRLALNSETSNIPKHPPKHNNEL